MPSCYNGEKSIEDLKMPRGRPGGNPGLKKYSFTTDRDEPCNAKYSLRMPASELERLKKIPDYHEKVREAIRALVESAELEQTQLSGPGNETEPTPTQGN
jgi:hypothetical protein